MGSSSSRPETPPVCEDCQKDKQKPLPPRDGISADGKPCAPFYDFVEKCMAINNGQISLCKEEWDVFRKCHDANKNLNATKINSS